MHTVRDHRAWLAPLHGEAWACVSGWLPGAVGPWLVVLVIWACAGPAWMVQVDTSCLPMNCALWLPVAILGICHFSPCSACRARLGLA